MSEMIEQRQINTTTVGSSNYATSSDDVAWTTYSNISPYYELHGYIDSGISTKYIVNRGTSLTGDKASAYCLPATLFIRLYKYGKIGRAHV